VPKRRVPDPSFYARVTGAGGALAGDLWAKATARPVDSVAVLLAAAASLLIITNAVFLQSGSHPAPFFTNPKPLQAASDLSKPVAPFVPARPAAAAAIAPQLAVVRHNDPIADLIDPSPRIAAVQRALSQYGYGQIKPTGVLDDATAAAIEKFERGHKLPVTGRISDRLVSDLAAMVGHPLD
jgi:Putative peptidoglycan binding domain